MPELPEVETTKRGIRSHIINSEIKNLTVRQKQLRWPIPENLSEQIIGYEIKDVKRRGKYLLFQFECEGYCHPYFYNAISLFTWRELK